MRSLPFIYSIAETGTFGTYEQVMEQTWISLLNYSVYKKITTE